MDKEEGTKVIQNDSWAHETPSAYPVIARRRSTAHLHFTGCGADARPLTRQAARLPEKSCFV